LASHLVPCGVVVLKLQYVDPIIRCLKNGQGRERKKSVSYEMSRLPEYAACRAKNRTSLEFGLNLVCLVSSYLSPMYYPSNVTHTQTQLSPTSDLCSSLSYIQIV
jgi:hypothetical protein